MNPSPLDFSRTGKPAQIQENMIVYMRLFEGLPGMISHDAELYWFVCGKHAPGDTVLKARWPDEGVEERIDEMFEQIGQHIDEIDWMVFPATSRRISTSGWKRAGCRVGRAATGCGLTWLARFWPRRPQNFHIEQVRDDQGMAEWVRVSEAGFGQELGWFYDAYARHGYGPDAFSLHYTGYLGDTPVTSGTLLDAGGTAAIYDCLDPACLPSPGAGRRDHPPPDARDPRPGLCRHLDLVLEHGETSLSNAGLRRRRFWSPGT